MTAEQADHRVTQMRRAFPHATDHSAGYLQLVDAMTNHPKDRHVLAAAVASGAALIVPTSRTSPLGPAIRTESPQYTRMTFSSTSSTLTPNG